MTVACLAYGGECRRTAIATKVGSDWNGLGDESGHLFRPRETVVGFPRGGSV